LARGICRMRELMGQTKPDQVASRTRVINRNQAPLPEQPHPGSAPGRPHSWNSCTLGEPAPSSWVHPLPLSSGDPGTRCRLGMRSWGARRGCRASALSGGAEHSAGLTGSLPAPPDVGACCETTGRGGLEGLSSPARQGGNFPPFSC